MSTPPRKHRTTVIDPPTHAGHISSEEEEAITSKEQEISATESKKSDPDNNVAPKRPKYDR